MPLRQVAPSPPQLPDSLHAFGERTIHINQLVSYMDTLMKTASESIKKIMRRRRIMFAGIVARMEDTRLQKCVMVGTLVGGAGCVRTQEKEWMVCLLDGLRAFGTNAHQWTTAAQDEGGWHKAAEQGAERFMAKLIAAENVRAGLRPAVVCPIITVRSKERIAQSKRVR